MLKKTEYDLSGHGHLISALAESQQSFEHINLDPVLFREQG